MSPFSKFNTNQFTFWKWRKLFVWILSIKTESEWRQGRESRGTGPGLSPPFLYEKKIGDLLRGESPQPPHFKSLISIPPPPNPTPPPTSRPNPSRDELGNMLRRPYEIKYQVNWLVSISSHDNDFTKSAVQNRWLIWVKGGRWHVHEQDKVSEKLFRDNLCTYVTDDWSRSLKYQSSDKVTWK